VVSLVLPDQRREMNELMSKAGITPHTTRVRPGDRDLTRITGARPPARPAAPPSGRPSPSTRPHREDMRNSPKRRPRRRTSALNT
jgi:hypothetical protein